MDALRIFVHPYDDVTQETIDRVAGYTNEEAEVRWSPKTRKIIITKLDAPAEMIGHLIDDGFEGWKYEPFHSVY